MTKPWYASKMIWLNAASGGVAFIAAGLAAMGDAVPLPKWAILLVGGAFAAANVALRFVTTDAITIRRINASDGINDGGTQ